MISPNDKYPIPALTDKMVFLKPFITNPNITIGDYTYYDAEVNTPETFETLNVIFGFKAKLTIGKFCQIARGTKFMLADSNHQMEGFSTYPFFVFGLHNDNAKGWADYNYDYPLKKDTVIGNDVWFGHECVIMPGVTIGDGAIIAARSVVIKDVLPYTIVGGNPAKPLKQRFCDELIVELQQIQWWNWDYEKISRNIRHIVAGDIQELQNAK
jgi:virginiamycin A acetyltransferase